MHFPDTEGIDNLTILLAEIDSIEEVAEWLLSMDASAIEMIIHRSNVTDLQRTFPLNAKLAQLSSQGGSRILTTDITPLSTLILSDSAIHHPIKFGTAEKYLTASTVHREGPFGDAVSNIAETAEPLAVDILPWRELLTQLAEIVDSETREEFQRLIEAARIENVGALDEIAVAIVAAAHSGALLNDLSTWAEEVGLASKATFSRKKKSLEDSGVIYTEKVPIEIGRPKLKLQLADNINEVHIEGENMDIARTPPGTNQSANDKSGSTSSTSPEQGSDDDILTSIEQEVQEAIRSE